MRYVVQVASGTLEISAVFAVTKITVESLEAKMTKTASTLAAVAREPEGRGSCLFCAPEPKECLLRQRVVPRDIASKQGRCE